MNEPKTLKQAIEYFSDPDSCHEFLAARRFPDGVMCPHCGSKERSLHRHSPHLGVQAEAR